MNVSLPPQRLQSAPDQQAPLPARPGMLRKIAGRVGDVLASKLVTVLLATLAVGLGVLTFVLLAGGTPLGVRADVGVALVLANLTVLLLLGAALAGRLTRVVMDSRNRRRESEAQRAPLPPCPHVGSFPNR